MDKNDESISDEGNFSSVSSTSGLSGYVDDYKNFNHRTDAGKQLFLNSTHINDLSIVKYWNFDQPLEHNNYLKNELFKCKQGLVIKSSDEAAMLLQLEIKQLQNENIILNDKLNVMKEETLQLQNAEKNYKDQIFQFNNSKNVREACIARLKEKIKQQHEEYQALLYEYSKIKTGLSHTQNEITTMSKSVDWYKKQWQINKSDKEVLSKRVMDLQTALKNKCDKIVTISDELKDSQMQVQKQYDKIHKLMLEKSIQPHMLNDLKTATITLPKEEHSQYYKEEIESLNNELKSLRETLTKQTELFSQLVKEKCEILEINTVQQKQLNEMQLQLQIHQGAKVKAYSLISNYEVTIKDREQQLLQLTTQINNLQLTLSAISTEKQSVQESINQLQGGIQKLLAIQEELRDELNQKEKQLFFIEQQRQSSFMEHNWQKCNIEEYKMKEENHLKKTQSLNDDIGRLNHDIIGLKTERNKFKFELSEIKRQYRELLSAYNLLTEEHKNSCSEIDGLKLNYAPEGSSEVVKFNESINKLCKKFKIQTNGDMNDAIHNIELYLDSKNGLLCNCCEESNKVKEQLEENYEALTKNCLATQDLVGNLEAQIRRLKDRIHLKDVALYDTKKRYELYNRVLLRKSKEHLREKRNTMKENERLKQEQHISTQQMNILKLQVNHAELNLETLTSKLVKKVAHVKQLENLLDELKKQLQEKNSIIAKLETDKYEIELESEKLLKEFNQVKKLHDDLYTNFVSELQQRDLKITQINDERTEYQYNFDKYARDYNELRKLHDELVSIHLHCPSDNEMEKSELQKKLDFYMEEVKIANCTIENNSTKSAELEEELMNARTLIATMEQENVRLRTNLQTNVNEKSFLQRLIIDLRAALNASTSKIKLNDATADDTHLQPSLMELAKFVCPPLVDEEEILHLIDRSSPKRVVTSLKQSLNDLKGEVSYMRKEIYSDLF